MLTRLRRWFAPPAGEKSSPAAARLLNQIILVLGALTLLTSVLLLVTQTSRLSTVLFAAVVVLALGLAGGLAARGQLQLARLLLVAGLWSLSTTYTVWGGGLRAPAFALEVVVILLSGLLLNRWAALLMTGLSSLTGLVVLAAGQAGQLPTAIFEATPFTSWAAYTAAFVSAGAVLYLYLHSRAAAQGQADRDEAALRESEARYRQLFAAHPQPLWVTSPGPLTFLAANAAAAQLYDYPLNEFLALKLTDLWPAGAAPAALAERGPSAAAGSWRHRRRDGSEIEVDLRVELIDFAGRPAALMVAEDNTASRAAEATLRESEQRYRALFASAQRQAQELELLNRVRSAIARSLELPELFRTIVDAIAETFGYALVSLYWLEGGLLALQHQVSHDPSLVHAPLSLARLEEVVRRGEALLVAEVWTGAAPADPPPDIQSEICVPLLDQSRVVGALTVESRRPTQLTEADLRLMTALSSVINVAIERARLYTEVRQNAQRFQALIEGSSDAISLIDTSGVIRYSSPSTQRVIGYAPSERLGSDPFAHVHPDDQPAVAQLFRQLLQHPDETVTITARFRHSNGSWRWTEATGTNRLHDPAVQGVVVNYRDITERKQADEARQRSLAELKNLQGITQILLTLEALPEIMQRVAQGIVTHLGYDFALATRYVEAEGMFVGLALAPAPPPELAARTLALAESLAGPASIDGLCVPYKPGSNLWLDRVLRGEMVVNENLADILPPALPPGVVDALAQWAKGRRYLSLPMQVKGRTVGAILASTRQDSLPNEQRAALRRVADQAAVAVEKARLYEAERQRTEELIRANAQLRQEVAERRRVEAALRESEQRYALAAQAANDGLWDLDLTTGQAYYSPRWRSMLGYTEGEVGARLEDWLDRVHPEEHDQVKMRLAAHLDGTTPSFESEHRLRHRDGTYRWILTRGLAVRDEAGVPLRMAGSATDITDRKRAEAQLLHDAFHDALTGLPNRALFVDRLEQAIKRAHRRDGYAFAVLFLDLDRFKVVNDSLGHRLGDQLLVALAERLSTSLRAADTFARLGGDEFVILLDDIRDAEEVSQIAERIQEQLAIPFDLNSLELVTTASIGVVLSEAGHERADELLRDADLAMYRAKALGRAQHAVFDPALRDAALERLALEADLRRALNRQEFRVYYQPIISLRRDQLVGFEALVRWEHPERGLLVPGQFIAVAEESGLVIALDRWVMEAACRQLREWQRQFPQDPPLTLNVNLSSRHFTRPDLAEQVKAILDATGVTPSHLRLEITESMIMENIGLAKIILEQLHALGVQVEIDDFGTGYSSLGYLVELPVDTLKIDRSFVSQILLDDSKAEIVHTIITLAQNLKLNAIAEGIETPGQRIQLAQIGCDYGQGYHISQPLSAVEAGVWIPTQRAQGPSVPAAV